MEKKENIFGYSGETENLAMNIAKKIDPLRKNFYVLLQVIGALLVALGGDFAYDIEQSKELFTKGKYIVAILFNNWLLFAAGAILLFFGVKGNAEDNKNLKEENITLKSKRKETVRKLQSKQDNIDEIKNKLDSSKEDIEKLHSKIQEKHSELVKNWLKVASLNANLNTYERLTIYYENEDEFTLLSRYSQNKEYDKIHKQKFPLKIGVISKTWAHNEYIENESPSYEDEKEEYIKYMINKYNYKEETINNINMKSDSFFGLAIQEADENIGVLLYEKISRTDDKLDFDTKCDNIRSSYTQYTSYLTKYVQNAIQLDRSYGIKNVEGSPESDLLSKLKGRKDV